MSREEAVEILSDMRAEYNLFGDEGEATRYHVLSWAIQEMNATQGDVCSNCKNHYTDDCPFERINCETPIQGCKAFDGYAAEKQGKWIPCEERLPEEDKEVLISYRYKEGEGDPRHVDIDITTYGQMYFGGQKVGEHKHWRAPFEYFASNYEVIAWMPLPKPWKGEEG